MLVLAKRLLSLAILAGLPFILAPAGADAQSLNCAPHERLLKSLESRYGEEPVGAGVTNQGKLMEILASPNGSWSVIVSSPNGLSCLVAAGEGWRHIDPKATDDPLAKALSLPEPQG